MVKMEYVNEDLLQYLFPGSFSHVLNHTFYIGSLKQVSPKMLECVVNDFIPQKHISIAARKGVKIPNHFQEMLCGAIDSSWHSISWMHLSVVYPCCSVGKLLSPCRGIVPFQVCYCSESLREQTLVQCLVYFVEPVLVIHWRNV